RSKPLSAVQLPAPAKQLARLYSGLASDRRRNCTRRHRGCKDALLLGSRPSPALPNQSHYLVFSLITGEMEPTKVAPSSPGHCSAAPIDARFWIFGIEARLLGVL